MSPTPRQLGHRVASRRKAKGWSRYRLATEVGISRNYVGQIETGHSSPTVEMLQKIAQALGVPVTALLS